MKNKFLVEGRPTVVLMACGRTPERVLELIEAGHRENADAFGIQIEKLNREYQTESVIKRLIDAAKGKKTYITNYRTDSNEGKSDDELACGLVAAAKLGGDLIDVMGDMFCRTEGEMTDDIDAIDRQKKLIDEIHTIGREVLMSSHTHKFMSKEEVFGYISRQRDRGADIAKLVAGAGTNEEMLENVIISAEIEKENMGPALFLCTGGAAMRHRILGPAISDGMILCVSEEDEFTFGIQPKICDAVNEAKLIEKYMRNNKEV